MWLTLIVLLHINTLVEGPTISADDVKAKVCPNCRTIHDGDIEEFWVEHEDGDIFLSRAHIEKDFQKGSYVLGPRAYALYEIPVYLGNDEYHNYLLEVNRKNQLKIHQIALPNGNFELPTKGEAYINLYSPFSYDRSTSFVHEQYFVANENFGCDMTRLCDKSGRSNLPKAWSVKKCFSHNAKCVTDYKTGDILTVTQKDAIYKWGQVIVWVGCVQTRCIYLIHDTVSGNDWYIPDSIKISTNYIVPTGRVHALIPLFTSTTPFLKKLEQETEKEESNKTLIYVISAAAVAVIIALLATVVLLYLMYRKRQKKNKAAKTLVKQLKSTSASNPPEKVKKPVIPFSKEQPTSQMPSSLATSSVNLNETTVRILACTAEQDKMFEANEVEGLEAEMPHKQLEGTPKPEEGTYVVFKHIGVTLPPKVFAHTFGEFDLNLGQERRTVVYEYESCGLKRIEAISTIMAHAKHNQKNGTIQEMVCTVRLDKLNIQLLVTPKLGPSVESTVRSGGLSLEEKINLVSQTLSCMEDLLECNVIHRDIKPSSFRYDIDGPKIFITNLGLARIPAPYSRSSVPFFGNVVFASLSTHLKHERTHYDDMISWFYVVLFIINKEMLVWKAEKDKTRIYQLKNNFLDEKVVKQHVTRLIKKPKTQNLIRSLHELVVHLPVKKKPTYSNIRNLVNSLTK